MLACFNSVPFFALEPPFKLDQRIYGADKDPSLSCLLCTKLVPIARKRLMIFMVQQAGFPLEPLHANIRLKLTFCDCRGDLEHLRRLIEIKVNPNLGEHDKRTALHQVSCLT